jgi:hypothetical protein
MDFKQAAGLGLMDFGSRVSGGGGLGLSSLLSFQERQEAKEEEALFASTIKEMRDQKIDPLSQGGFNLLIDKGLITTPGDFFKYHELAKKDDKALEDMILRSGKKDTPTIYREAVERKIGQKITSPELEEAQAKVESLPLEKRKLAAQTGLSEADLAGQIKTKTFIDSVLRGGLVKGLDPNNTTHMELLEEAAKIARANMISKNMPDPKNTITRKGTALVDFMWDAMTQVGLADPEIDKKWGLSDPVYNVRPEMNQPGSVTSPASLQGPSGQPGMRAGAASAGNQAATGQQDERARINAWGEQRAIEIMKANPKMTYEKALMQARDEYLSGVK